MPKLISTRGARDAFVADENADQWRSMVASGDWKIADGEDVSIVDPYGHQSVVGHDVLAKDQERGVGDTIESQGTVVRRAREKRLEGLTSAPGAFVRHAVGAATFGLTDALADDETLEADELHHSTASALGTLTGLGGSLLLGNDMGVGRLFGEGAEGARVSEGVRELGAAQDALTAEHVGSTLSTNALLGGTRELSAGERALGRAGRALDEGTATRAGIANVPADLVGLDAAGLKRAAVEERAALKVEAETERASLEDLRKPQREELASQIRDMHHELEAERPVFYAVNGADVEAIEGVRNIKVQLAKSYKSMRAGLDSPLSVARDPSSMIRPLEMRQTALEALQEKAPEIRAVLGDDARAAALDHVDDALAQTREQIAAIRRLDSRANPVTGSRLTMLQEGTSPRLAAIEAAQEALKAAPEVGLLQKGVQAGAFAGVTAVAHAIPGVGIMAPFAGKWAADAIGKVFEHLAAGKTAIVDRSARALDTFLGATKAAAQQLAPRVPLTAAKVLARVRFGPSSSEPSGTEDLAQLFHARSTEVRQQTMYDASGRVVVRPDVRLSIAQRLAAIGAVNPILADKLEGNAVRKLECISRAMPRRPDVGGLQIGPDNWQPSSLAIRSWARTIRAVEDPGSVEEDLAHGTVTPEAAAAYREVYPERFAEMQRSIFAAAPQLSRTLPMQKKIALSIFTGVPVTPTLQPNVLAVLQATFAAEPGTAGGTHAPMPQPNFSAFGSTPSKDKTAAQMSEEP
jgi:hypothetical protein